MAKTPVSKIKPASIEELIEIGQSKNTERARQSALRHFEIEFGGSLPTDSLSIERYILAYQDKLSPDTIRQRLAHLATWHKQQGFPNPTNTQSIQDALKSLRVHYGRPTKRAKALTLEHLERIIESIEQRRADVQPGCKLTPTEQKKQRALELTLMRDKCFVLIGFWCGFRSEQLVNLEVEHIEEQIGEQEQQRTITLFLPKSKGDREARGQSWILKEHLGSTRHLCPVNAYIDWVMAARLEEGPLFSKIDHWGTVWRKPLHINSVMKLLRQILIPAGLPAELYSTHSLRRGFANFAIDLGAPVHELKRWVKWKDDRSVQPYLDERDDLPTRLVERIEAKAALPPQHTKPT